MRKDTDDTALNIYTIKQLNINDTNTKILEGANNSVRVQTNSGYGDIGAQNTSYFHFTTDRPKFWFSKPVSIQGDLEGYSTVRTIKNFKLQLGSYVLDTLVDNNKVPDSDKLDGYHASSFALSNHTHSKEDVPVIITWGLGINITNTSWGGGSYVLLPFNAKGWKLRWAVWIKITSSSYFYHLKLGIANSGLSPQYYTGEITGNNTSYTIKWYPSSTTWYNLSTSYDCWGFILYRYVTGGTAYLRGYTIVLTKTGDF